MNYRFYITIRELIGLILIGGPACSLLLQILFLQFFRFDTKHDASVFVWNLFFGHMLLMVVGIVILPRIQKTTVFKGPPNPAPPAPPYPHSKFENLQS